MLENIICYTEDLVIVGLLNHDSIILQLLKQKFSKQKLIVIYFLVKCYVLTGSSGSNGSDRQTSISETKTDTG